MMKWRVVLLAFLLILGFWRIKPALAEEDCLADPKGWPPEKLERCSNELEHLYELSKAATTPLESEIKNLGNRVNALQMGIGAAVAKQKKLGLEVADREEKVAEHYVLFGKKIRELYKSIRGSSLLVQILSRMGVGQINREIAYQGTASNVDKQLIVGLSDEILSLETDKKRLEEQKIKLALLQETLNKQADFFKGEVVKAKNYQADLSGKIAQMTAAMEEIIGNKIDSLNLSTSLGGGPLYCVDDRKLDPGFGNGFAFYTFGIPHRVGMSQYGARMRAQRGQGYEQILRTYYDNISIEKIDENTEILVNGRNDYGQTFNNERMKIEDYMKHIYEMPGDWEMEALKAQAIAARSYALAVMRDEGKIEPNQRGQEIKKEENTQKWKDAVEQTKGMVLRSGGQIAKAWYASTAGGYTYKSSDVWSRETAWTKRLRDTDGDIGSLGDLLSKAYDRESPCMYTAQGFRKEYGKSAWLKPEEVADIANVIFLIRRDSSIDRTVLCGEAAINKKCHDTWSADKVKEELKKRGGQIFDYVSEVTMNGFDFGLGRTNGIRLRDRSGREESFDGEEFKNFFNLRAPANIVIVGPLFNIEKK